MKCKKGIDWKKKTDWVCSLKGNSYETFIKNEVLGTVKKYPASAILAGEELLDAASQKLADDCDNAIAEALEL